MTVQFKALKARDALEEIARAGREAWELLFELLEHSEQEEEIESFFAEWVEKRSSSDD